jgi:hypothetical protein
VAVAATASLGMGCGLVAVGAAPAGAATAGPSGQAVSNPFDPVIGDVAALVTEVAGLALNGLCNTVHLGAGSICDPVP